MSYPMPLAQLLSVLNIETDEQGQVEELVIDSRLVKPGSLFFAYPGDQADGRDYIANACEAGAIAILCEAQEFIESDDWPDVPVFPVAKLQSQVGVLAHHFYGKPSEDMQVFGVTGTNGKTTCCYLLAQALQQLGLEVAIIGTIGLGKITELQTNTHTTPDPIAIHRLLALWRDQGVTQVCMEVSSHALVQSRVAGVQFFCTLFTNLSHDHLDYHGDMPAYGAAKLLLFTDYPCELVITNADDELGARIIDLADSGFISSYGETGDVFLSEIELSATGMSLFIEANGVDLELQTCLVGKVNIPNILLLVTTLLSLSTSVEDIQLIVSKLQPAPGRMELYSQQGRPRVVVDYAHTPDALVKALLSVREHCEGELWCVFGCGGDRDRAKRPVMGAAADKHADRVIVTNDNPRSEDPQAIAREIVAGINGDALVVLDRFEAIATAIDQAKPSDWVLVAGKGHEITQQIGDQYLDFSDRLKVSEILGAVA
jgi:UDP-N-acetylmuramoyl-L-alanyl-D-glutamate--2,6-diaminopimelate ligase